MNEFVNSYPRPMDKKFNQLKKEVEKQKEDLEREFIEKKDIVPVNIKPCNKDLSDKIVH